MISLILLIEVSFVVKILLYATIILG